jgi:hypothetical protein
MCRRPVREVGTQWQVVGAQISEAYLLISVLPKKCAPAEDGFIETSTHLDIRDSVS